jgi:menaquinone-9 beta-reductase
LTSSPQLDVLIVGAGPAGSVTALLLARAGVRVRIVDRSTFPREKLCGDTLNPGALAILEHHGLAGPLHGRALRVDGMTVTGLGQVSVTGAYGPGIYGLALSRRDLDAALLDAAIAAGARFDPAIDVRAPLMAGARVEGARLRTTAGEEDVRSPVTVAADGRHSRLAFGLGLARFARRPRRWAFGAYYTGVGGLTTFGEMHVRADGYIGVALVPGGLANVCVVRESAVGATATQAAALRGDVIAAAIGADPALSARFVSATRVSDVTVLGPLAVECDCAGLPGLLLAGDAAGFIDPMTGDGLRFAIRGAELAAAAALRELETGDAQFARLTSERRREFSMKWKMNRALRSLVASPAGLRTASVLASLWSGPIARLIPFAGDVPSAARIRHA